MVFYHGYECYDTWYDFLWQQLVPLGIIVVLPNDYVSSNVSNQTLCALSQRYTLEWLTQKCNMDPKCPLYGMVSNQSIAAGHSMGGGASLLSVSSEYPSEYPLNQFVSQFNAAFTFSGSGHNQQILDAVPSIDVPVFLLTASHDCLAPPGKTAIHFYEAMPNTTCKLVADIKNGTHCGFMNAPPIHQDACNTFNTALCPYHDHKDIGLMAQLDITIKYLKMFLNASIMLGEFNPIEIRKIETKLADDEESGIMEEYSMSC